MIPNFYALVQHAIDPEIASTLLYLAKYDG
jgi:hypothetical protein